MMRQGEILGENHTIYIKIEQCFLIFAYLITSVTFGMWFTNDNEENRGYLPKALIINMACTIINLIMFSIFGISAELLFNVGIDKSVGIRILIGIAMAFW